MLSTLDRSLSSGYSALHFVDTYPLDSNLFLDSAVFPFEQLGHGVFRGTTNLKEAVR